MIAVHLFLNNQVVLVLLH